MRIKPLFGLIASAILFVSSCATSNEVNGGAIFQKRKYNKGFYLNRGSSSSESASKIEKELIESDQSFLENSSAQIKGQNSDPASLELNLNESADARNLSAKSESVKTENEISFIHGINQGSFDQTIHPIKKMAHAQSKLIKNTSAKAIPPRGGDLGYILGLVLLILLIVLLFKILDSLLFGIFGTVLAILIIILLLRWLGVF